MNNFKEKSKGFVVGVMVGLIIAGGFFILKLDDYFKQLNFYKKVSETFSSDPRNNEVPVKSEDLTDQKEKKQDNDKPKIKKEVADNSKTKTDFVLNADTLNTHETRDTLHTENVNSVDNIVVRKDELLFTRTFEIINLSPVASTAAPKDSLLQKISGVNDDRNSKQFLNIEFWQSPLNYKGYKMSKYKLVLYGITSADGIKLYKSEENIYFKNAGMIYRLDYASDFKPYERISDESIINKLK